MRMMEIFELLDVLLDMCIEPGSGRGLLGWCCEDVHRARKWGGVYLAGVVRMCIEPGSGEGFAWLVL